MYLLPTENKGIVGFEALLAQAMRSVPAIPLECSLTNATVYQSSFSPPIYEEMGDDEDFYPIGA